MTLKVLATVYLKPIDLSAEGPERISPVCSVDMVPLLATKYKSTMLPLKALESSNKDLIEKIVVNGTHVSFVKKSTEKPAPKAIINPGLRQSRHKYGGSQLPILTSNQTDFEAARQKLKNNLIMTATICSIMLVLLVLLIIQRKKRFEKEALEKKLTDETEENENASNS